MAAYEALKKNPLAPRASGKSIVVARTGPTASERHAGQRAHSQCQGLRSNGNVVLEKNAQSIVDRKENQFRNSKYSKQYKKAYEQYQEKTSRISRPCDEKGKARAFVDNRKDRRKKKQRSSKNKNTRRYSSLAGKKHCGDVCGCKRSRKVEGHDRLRLQQTRQLMMMMNLH